MSTILDLTSKATEILTEATEALLERNLTENSPDEFKEVEQQHQQQQFLCYRPP